ncbi:Peptidase family M28 [Catalinimonas alkaloidigena]|uniref:Peptidase family M28 n=1 Tax=Catalinimonas alkaloidigena TaxID=1075417 RepID=A0A1G9F056_9BACT|nr:M28 family peptidase [Catalinimonas alkaloidigena]SDK81807.1 Peptidase family M28 [Catalinimonas alkaloidigena]
MKRSLSTSTVPTGKALAFGLGMMLLVSACDDTKTSQTTENSPPPAALVQAPDFNADSAYAFVEAQVAFGPRVPNTPAHRQCGDYLVNYMRGIGWEVQEQNFEATAWDETVLNGRNIISTLNPQANKRILLMAHWDTRPYADQDSVRQREPIEGANDGGSGVAVLMEVARVLQASNLPQNLGVDIIFTDAEDYGQPESERDGAGKQDTWCLGAQHWAKNPHRKGFYYGILLDMVGAEGAQFARDEISMQAAPSVVDRVWKIGTQLGYSSYFSYQTASGLLDEHYYVNRIARIPMIDIIQYDPVHDDYFYEHWHTHEDTLEHINRETLKAVGQTLLQTLFQEAGPVGA